MLFSLRASVQPRPSHWAARLVLCAARGALLSHGLRGCLWPRQTPPLVDGAQCPLCWTGARHSALRGGPSAAGRRPVSGAHGTGLGRLPACPRSAPARAPLRGLTHCASVSQALFPQAAGEGQCPQPPARGLGTGATPLREARRLPASTPSADGGAGPLGCATHTPFWFRPPREG